MQEEARRFKMLKKKFSANQEVDTSMGRCCCKIKNEKAAKIIMCLDLIFISNLPRWLFVAWAMYDEQ